MAQQLKNILHFVNIPAGATVQQPHKLHNETIKLRPDLLALDPGQTGLTITTDDTNVTVTNTTLVPVSFDMLCETWHTIERSFGPDGVTKLVPQPFIIGLSTGGGGGGPTNPMALPDQWIATGIEGDSTGTMFSQVSSNFQDLIAIRAGSLVGLRARLPSDVLAGTIIAEVTINGGNTGFFATIGVGSLTGFVTAPVGGFPYVQGDRIGLRWETDLTFSFDNNYMECWVEVEEEL